MVTVKFVFLFGNSRLDFPIHPVFLELKDHGRTNQEPIVDEGMSGILQSSERTQIGFPLNDALGRFQRNKAIGTLERL